MQAIWNKILCIRLWNKSFKVWETKEKLYRQYIGGCGVGIKILHDMTGAKTDALGAYNPIVWMTGAVTLTESISFERYHVISRSPLTGKISASSAGGLFGTALKKAGWDGLVVTGVSDVPVSIIIKDDKVEFVSADTIWGKDTLYVEEYMKKQYGEECGVSSIGPSGENLIPLAGIASLVGNSRMAGRGGLGAVMGSKRLKAIVVSGSQKIEVANKTKLANLNKKISSKVRENNISRNASSYKSVNDSAENTAKEAVLNKNFFCLSCSMECDRNSKLLHGVSEKNIEFGLDQESMKLMGDSCMVKDSESINKAADLCNRYGIDVIDAATVIAVAMKCYEKGFLTVNDLGGIEAELGNGTAFVALTEKICKGEGIGKLLGKGAALAIRRIPGAEMLGFPVEGLSVGYNKNQNAVKGNSDEYYNYFMSRLKNRDNYEKSRKKDKTYDFSSTLECIIDSLEICKFSAYGQSTLSDLCETYAAVTGSKLTEKELLAAGERISRLKQF